MTPDDPRHGTYAGYEAHKKSKTPWCEPCADAGYKARKRARIAGPALIEVGAEAYKIVTDVPPAALARATGLAPRTLHQIKRNGPTAKVRRPTRDAILRAQSVTPIGVVRRLRALAALGWSVAEVARRAGLSRWNVERTRREDNRVYIYADFADRIVAIYDALMMTPAPPSRSATRQVWNARAQGWAPPLAYENIDDPDDQPTDWHYTSASREQILRELVDDGGNITTAIRTLKTSREALQVWCKRNDLSALYLTLTAREQRTRGVA